MKAKHKNEDPDWWFGSEGMIYKNSISIGLEEGMQTKSC